ncbi:unnamed protein product [Periconia digitata]|uniref:Uncharacterized protein n=1 Tax=Periconia digitata TaxID=1303443 RepID=A0A9W4UNZ1_9PLEO|nr:unnamed protein product [Periconia digitata]
MSSDSKPSPIFSFIALYFATLFSLDTWAAARASPYRAPSSVAYNRPANMPPPRDSYQGGMHGQGRHGPSSDGNLGGRRPEGRIASARDSRPPMRIGANARCGACMT